MVQDIGTVGVASRWSHVEGPVGHSGCCCCGRLLAVDREASHHVHPPPFVKCSRFGSGRGVLGGGFDLEPFKLQPRLGS